MGFPAAILAEAAGR